MQRGNLQSLCPMNSNVEKFLEQYIADEDPRYAVVLRGKWGCGKTFFVDKWVEPLKNRAKAKTEDPDSIELQPILVSLYGMKEIGEVVNEIDRQLHPFLHSKLMKIGKGALSFFGKAVLKTDFDLDGKNEKDDLSISMSLDSLSVLFSNNKGTVGGNKILIFDDFERCNIDLKELLGFINSFVERGGCHVIVVGDLGKLESVKNTLFAEFKEKTIGKILEIHPETEKAIEEFLKDTHEWMHDKKDLILECFEITDTHNLRLLRQALRDFNYILQEYGDFSKDSLYLKGFFLTFIAVTLLYNQREHHKDMEEFANYVGNSLKLPDELREK